MKTDQVSILMPVYNGERYLKEAIDSILAQDYKHWELVIVDDGSADRTKEIITSYQDQRIRYFYQDNRGQASALNLALNKATGQFVTTLDADDWLPLSSIRERVDYLQSHLEHGAVYGNGFYCSEDGQILARFSDYCLSNITGDLYGYLVVSNMFGTGAAVLIRRESIDQASLQYDEQIVWCQDWDFYVCLAENVTFGYIDAITVNYRLHGSNMTMQMPSQRQMDSVIKTRHKILNSARFSQLSPRQRVEFFDDFLRNNLRDQSLQQRAMLDHSQFQVLPDDEKGRLVRLLTLDYILSKDICDHCGEWLRIARSFFPLDRKTGLVHFLYKINPSLAKTISRIYRKSKDIHRFKNPYELVQSVSTSNQT